VAEAEAEESVAEAEESVAEAEEPVAEEEAEEAEEAVAEESVAEAEEEAEEAVAEESVAEAEEEAEEAVAVESVAEVEKEVEEAEEEAEEEESVAEAEEEAEEEAVAEESVAEAKKEVEEAEEEAAAEESVAEAEEEAEEQAESDVNVQPSKPSQPNRPPSKLPPKFPSKIPIKSSGKSPVAGPVNPPAPSPVHSPTPVKPAPSPVHPPTPVNPPAPSPVHPPTSVKPPVPSPVHPPTPGNPPQPSPVHPPTPVNLPQPSPTRAPGPSPSPRNSLSMSPVSSTKQPSASKVDNPFVTRIRQRLHGKTLRSTADIIASIAEMHVNVNDSIDYGSILYLDEGGSITIPSLMVDAGKRLPALLKASTPSMNAWLRAMHHPSSSVDQDYGGSGLHALLTLLTNSLSDIHTGSVRYISTMEAIMYLLMLGSEAANGAPVMATLKEWYIRVDTDNVIVDLLVSDPRCLCFWKAFVSRGRTCLRQVAQMLTVCYMMSPSLFKGVYNSLNSNSVTAAVTKQLNVQEKTDSMSVITYITTQLETLEERKEDF
jgi:hypothetical protein